MHSHARQHVTVVAFVTRLRLPTLKIYNLATDPFPPLRPESLKGLKFELVKYRGFCKVTQGAFSGPTIGGVGKGINMPVARY